MEASDQQRLLQAIENAPAPVYAVVDGALIDDLPALLLSADFFPRALYRNEATNNGIAAGPHLVPLPLNGDAAKLLALLGDRPEVVFWAWPSGEDGLYQHLRRINRVEIPFKDGAGNERTEPVLFRHASPSAMVSTVAVLSPDQLAQLFGDADGLIAPMETGPRILRRSPGLPARQPGFIRMTTEQVTRLGEDRRAKFKRRLIRHLKKHQPEAMRRIPASEERQMAEAMILRAASLGLRKEQAVALYARIEALFDFRFIGNPAHADLHGVLADQSLDEVMRTGMILRVAIDRAPSFAA